MKTVLIVLAIVGGVVVLAIGVGGYLIYTKGGAMMATAGDKVVEQFITTKNPPEPVAASLRRIMKDAPLQHSPANTMILVTTAVTSVQDGVVSDEEMRMLDEGAQLAEGGEITRSQLTDFSKKYQNLLSAGNRGGFAFTDPSSNSTPRAAETNRPAMP